jgi:hypothetical protein
MLPIQLQERTRLLSTHLPTYASIHPFDRPADTVRGCVGVLQGLGELRDWD